MNDHVSLACKMKSNRTEPGHATAKDTSGAAAPNAIDKTCVVPEGNRTLVGVDAAATKLAGKTRIDAIVTLYVILNIISLS